jgi:hypothetical protein
VEQQLTLRQTQVRVHLLMLQFCEGDRDRVYRSPGVDLGGG